jgi:hypothetical protein
LFPKPLLGGGVQISEEIQGHVSGLRELRIRSSYEATYFAKRHGISSDDAKRLIKQHGSDRDAADKAASKLK